MASLSVIAGPAGPVTDSSEPQADSPLSDVREAYAYAEQCRDRAARAKSVLVEVIRDAYMAGYGPRAIAAEMGVTRQYVQKILRESDAAELEAEKMAAELEASVKRDDKLSGWGADVGGNPQCSGCRTLLKHPTAECPKCGYVNGAGYMGVAATTSYLERWR